MRRAAPPCPERLELYHRPPRASSAAAGGGPFAIDAAAKAIARIGAPTAEALDALRLAAEDPDAEVAAAAAAALAGLKQQARE